MTTTDEHDAPDRQTNGQQRIAVQDALIEVIQLGQLGQPGQPGQVEKIAGALVVAAAHPASAFGADTARLIAGITQTGVVCINPRGLGGSSPASDISFERMVDDIESVRRQLGLPRWVFWGMSGGGWLAQLYARRHPDALAGIIVESACACFRDRLADPACALSPFFPAWHEPLRARGMLVEGSHANASAADDIEWTEVEGVGQVFRRRCGAALLVSPMPIDPDMKRAMPVLWTFDSRGWLDELRTPALVMAGSADPVVPVHRVRALHRALPGSTFVVIEGGGHVPSAEGRPEAVEAVRAFLAEHARA